MPTRSLERAVEEVAEQLRRHATVSLSDPDNPRAVIAQAEKLAEAVLRYEEILAEVTGWSSPLRHLDALDPEASAAPAPTEPKWSPESRWIHVDARYYLRVDHPAALMEYVNTKFGVHVEDPVAALRAIYDSDGWRPGDYPAGLVEVDDIGIDIYVERDH